MPPSLLRYSSLNEDMLVSCHWDEKDTRVSWPREPGSAGRSCNADPAMRWQRGPSTGTAGSQVLAAAGGQGVLALGLGECPRDRGGHSPAVRAVQASQPKSSSVNPKYLRNRRKGGCRLCRFKNTHTWFLTKLLLMRVRESSLWYLFNVLYPFAVYSYCFFGDKSQKQYFMTKL